MYNDENEHDINKYDGTLPDYNLSNQRIISDDAKRFLIELTQIINGLN